jgi:AraC-like DNA-binding protein
MEIFMKNFMSYDFDITKIVLGCFVPVGLGKIRHTDRPSHGLAFHLAGEKNYRFFNEVDVPIYENYIVYMPKGSSSTVETRQSGECYAINFQISEDVDFAPFSMKIKASSRVLDCFKSAEKHWSKKDAGHVMRVKSELYAILAEMQKEYRANYLPKSKYGIISPAIDYINENFAKEALSISDLSALCGITPEYFRRLFREFFGDSPIAYINKMKLGRAKDLLDSGIYSASDAALLSGYTDLSHFSREFKRYTGMAPRDYQSRK